MQRTVLLIIACLFIIGAWGGSAEAASEVEAIPVYVDGEILVTEPAPYIVKDRVMVPMRSIFEALAAEVNWDETERKVTGISGEDQVILFIDQTTAYVNEARVELETAPFIDANTWRTMVPLRLVGETLGAVVNWDEEKRLVDIKRQDRTDEDEGGQPNGTVIGSGEDSILNTIRNRHFDAGDLLRYTVSKGEVDFYEVLYDYSEDKALYNPVEAHLERIQGSLLMINPVAPATAATFRLNEDTIFFDATKEEAGNHEPLTAEQFKSFQGSRILVWSEKALEPNYRRAESDLAKLVLKVR